MHLKKSKFEDKLYILLLMRESEKNKRVWNFQIPLLFPWLIVINWNLFFSTFVSFLIWSTLNLCSLDSLREDIYIYCGYQLFFGNPFALFLFSEIKDFFKVFFSIWARKVWNFIKKTKEVFLSNWLVIGCVSKTQHMFWWGFCCVRSSALLSSASASLLLTSTPHQARLK